VEPVLYKRFTARWCWPSVTVPVVQGGVRYSRVVYGTAGWCTVQQGGVRYSRVGSGVATRTLFQKDLHRGRSVFSVRPARAMDWSEAIVVELHGQRLLTALRYVGILGGKHSGTKAATKADTRECL
jgi:hypothetical protein